MRAFVTGATGQDGYYLIKELEDRGHEVAALYRGQDERRLDEFKAEHPQVRWERGDVTDAASMQRIMKEIRPELVFNLAALSFVGLSWQMPALYMETNYGGLINVLEAVRAWCPDAHVVQASSSEMFGNQGAVALNEDSPMEPASPYGVSKLAAHRMCRVYRDSYGMRVSSAISFNHESPRRPPIFVTRKITQAAARRQKVTLGNLETVRDWGYAPEYMDAYVRMAMRETGGDFVIATGKPATLRRFADAAYEAVGLTWQDYVLTSPVNLRPNDLTYLEGDPRKAAAFLGWTAITGWQELARRMVAADCTWEAVLT